MSFLYNAIFGTSKESLLSENPEQSIQESVTLPTLPILVAETVSDIIEDCNGLLRLYGFELERDSRMCYYLRSSSKNEIHFLYIKTLFYPPKTVHYEIGIKELYYPHIQTLPGFHERMQNYKVPITVIDNNTIQIGTESKGFFIYLKDTELHISRSIVDTFSNKN